MIKFMRGFVCVGWSISAFSAGLVLLIGTPRPFYAGDMSLVWLGLVLLVAISASAPFTVMMFSRTQKELQAEIDKTAKLGAKYQIALGKLHKAVEKLQPPEK